MHNLTLLCKIYINQTLPHLSTLLPPSIILSEYTLRNSDDTQTVHARKTLSNSLFFPQLSENGIIYHKSAENVNNDLFLKRISDSPFCRCGANENALYFFLNCLQCAQQHADLVHTVSQHITVSLRVILFRDSMLSTQTNTFIAEAIHRIGTQRDFKSLSQN